MEILSYMLGYWLGFEKIRASGVKTLYLQFW